MPGGSIAVARLRARRRLLGAAAALLLVGVTALTTLVLQCAATATDGVRQRLEALPAADSLLEVTTSGPDGVTSAAPQDAAVRETADRTLADQGADVAVHASYRSGLLPVVGPQAQGPDGARRLVAVGYADLPSHAELVDGTWPGDAGSASGAVPVALHAAAADLLGLSAGDTVTAEIDGTATDVEVVGTWRPLDPDDAYFGGDPLEVSGSDGPVTLGPVVPAAGVDPGFGDVDLRWRVVPDPASVTAAELPRLAAGLDAFAAAVRGDPRLTNPAAGTPLADPVDRLVVESRAATATGTVPVVLLAVVLASALLLAASLLRGRHGDEDALVRARGGSPAQLTGQAGLQSVLVALPAALFAGPAGALAAGLLTGRAPSVAPVLADRSAWTSALLATLAGGVVLAAPSVVAARRWSVVQAAGGRRAAAARAGGEVALVVAAAVAVWQLRRYSGESPVVNNALAQTDPVLVAAPALALLAGAVVVARLVPALAAVAAPLLARRRGPTLALAAWEVARRPAVVVPGVLLLVLLVGWGVVATAYVGTWRQAQTRSATERTGTDLLVDTAPATTLLAAASLAEGERLTGVDGVGRVAAGVVDTRDVDGVTQTVLLADVAALAATAQPSDVRDDLAAALPALVAPVAAAELPETTFRVEVDVSVDATAQEPGSQPSQGDLPVDPSARTIEVVAHLVSPAGVGVALPPVRVAVDPPPSGVASATGTVAADLPAVTGTWRLVGWDVVSDDPRPTPSAATTADYGAALTISVTAVRAGATDAVPAPVTTDVPWRGSGGSPSAILVAVDGPWPAVRLTSSFAESGGLRVVAGEAAAVPSALVTRALAIRFDLDVGSSLRLQLPTGPLDVRVAGVVGALPGGSGPGALVDLSAASLAAVATGTDAPVPQRWWVSLVDPEDDAARRSALGEIRQGADVVVVDRVGDAATLRDRLPAAGVPPVLGASLVAVLLLVAAGIVLAATSTSATARRDAAVLRALGLSRSRSRRLAAATTGASGLLGVVLGLVLGGLVAALVVPGLVRRIGAGDLTAPPSRRLWTTDLVTDPLVALGLVVVVVAALLLVVAQTVFRARGPDGSPGSVREEPR